MVSYRDTKGIEDRWTYSTQTIEAGTGYVNHYSGSLVYVLDLGLDTGDFPYAAEYVYNSYLAGTEFFAAHEIEGAYHGNQKRRTFYFRQSRI